MDRKRNSALSTGAPKDVTSFSRIPICVLPVTVLPKHLLQDLQGLADLLYLPSEGGQEHQECLAVTSGTLILLRRIAKAGHD